MKRILLSLLTIAIVGGAATYAAYAYFTSNQAINGNVISTGTLNFEGILQDTNGSNISNFSVGGLAPGESITRCLWVKNTGTVAGRYKIYATAESGDNNLGNFLTVSSVLNPTTGSCAGLRNPFAGGTIYGTPNLSKPAWLNVAARGDFISETNTPFKVLGSEPAMPGDYYSLHAIIITLSPDATMQNASYTQNIALFGMQDAGSKTW